MPDDIAIVVHVLLAHPIFLGNHLLQLALGFGLNLADTFTRDLEHCANFFQGVLVFTLKALSVDEDLLLAFRECLEDTLQLFFVILVEGFLLRRRALLVLNEVLQTTLFLISDGVLERQWLLPEAQIPYDLLYTSDAA